MSERLSQSERRAQTRRRLLDAAAELFVDRGYHAVSLEEIAARAGFSRGALHYNFTAKQDLLLTLLDEHLAERGQQLGAARLSEDDPVAIAEDTIRALPFDRRFSLLFLEYTCAAARDPEIATAMRAQLDELRARNVPAAERVFRTAGVDEPPTRELVAALSALLNGLSIEALAGTDLDELEARFSLVLGLVLRGLMDSRV